MPTDITLQDALGNDLWKIACVSVDPSGQPDKANQFEILLLQNGAWIPYMSLNAVNGGVAVNRHSGMPNQAGFSIGLGKKDGSDKGGGINYLKMFSDDSLEEYFQFNQGMVPNADQTQIYGFQECIVQHSSYVPLVTNYQHRVRTIDDAGASTSARDAYVIDGGSLANGWERFIKIWGNGGAVVVGAISAYLNGLERRLRLWAGGKLVAECHEDGGFTIGNVPSKGPGTLNVAGGLFVNGVQK